MLKNKTITINDYNKQCREYYGKNDITIVTLLVGTLTSDLSFNKNIFEYH